MFEKIVKDYFSFSRKERIAVLILVFLIIIILLLPYLFPKPEGSFKEAETKDFAIQLSQPNAAKKQTAVKEGTSEDHNYKSSYESSSFHEDKLPKKAALFYFDPNTLSGDDWKRLGLPDKTIRTIHNYISKGGKFKNKEDIQKIYGLHANDVERLLPYVRIETTGNLSKQDYHARLSATLSPEGYNRLKSPHLLHLIDINKADTAEWIALPGRGSQLATRIVRFREKLGGFYSVDQLSEIYGLPDSTFQKIKPGLTVVNAAVSLININAIEVDELKQHPYIKWNIAAAIIEYRKQHGNFKSVEDLRKIDLITNDTYTKVVPYLKVE